MERTEEGKIHDSNDCKDIQETQGAPYTEDIAGIVPRQCLSQTSLETPYDI